MIIPDILEYMCQSKNKKVAVGLYQFHSLNLLSNSDWELLIPILKYCCSRTYTDYSNIRQLKKWVCSKNKANRLDGISMVPD